MTLAKDAPTTILKPARGWVPLNLRDLWAYRELIYFMTWRDLKVRYKQTLLGVGWAILRPFLSMVVFSVLFGGLAKIPSDGVPYPVFNYAALLPWGLFSKALEDASRSLVVNSHMITKVYFPRIILPLSSILAGVVDFGVSLLVFVGIMIFYKVPFSPNIWALLPLLLLAILTALGVGLWLSAMNVLYRDVGYVTPFMVQFWMYLTPIVYPSSMITSPVWKIVYALNPMAGVVEGFRWALYGSPAGAPGPMLLVSLVISLVLLVTGLFYFRRMERLFADMV
jgi:lipopolysaccharide transport system permease protein